MATSCSDPAKETDGGGGGEATADGGHGVDECKEKGVQATHTVKLDRRSDEERNSDGNSSGNSKSRRKKRREGMPRQDKVDEEREDKPGGAEEPQHLTPSKEGPRHPKYEEKKEWRNKRDKHFDHRYSDRRHDYEGEYYDRSISRHRKDEDGRDDYGRHRHDESYRHDGRQRYEGRHRHHHEKYRHDGRQRHDGSNRHRQYGQDERHRQYEFGEGHRGGGGGRGGGRGGRGGRGGGRGPRRHYPKPTLPPGVDSFKLEECDLFDSPLTSSLAHCVSEDMHMGKGIAVAFKRKFKRVDELLAQGVETGDVAVLEDNKRYIYYLVTKRKYYHRPTNDTLRSSLLAMREHILANKVKELHMPLIGCGLDELDWYTDVAYMIHEIFKEIKELEITVCYLRE